MQIHVLNQNTTTKDLKLFRLHSYTTLNTRILDGFN